MRISKPKQTAEYKIYSSIEERNNASGKFENGQEVKVLDASGDSNIKIGWAIYKYDKESNQFDLLEKEVQPIIPKPTIINTDEFSIFKNANKLSVPEAMFACRTNMRILEDFDFDLSFDGKNMQLTPVGGARTIKIAYDGVIKYLSIMSQKLSFSVFDNKGKGKRVHWEVDANVSDTDILSTYMVFTTNDLGSPVLVKPKSYDYQIPIMQVSVFVPANMSAPKAKDFVIHKYWKKALAPAEERIIIPKIPIENTDQIVLSKNTSVKTSLDNFIDLDSVLTFKNEWKLMQDFELNIECGNTLYIRAGAANDEFKEIPVSTPEGTKYLNISFWTMSAGIYPDASLGSLVNYHVMASIYDDLQNKISGNEGMLNPDGRPLDLGVTGSNMVCIATVQVEKPASAQPFNANSLKVFKHYKKALAPAEERIIIPEIPVNPTVIEADHYTIKHTRDSDLKPLTLVNPLGFRCYHPSVKFLTDFDFDFEFSNTQIKIKPRNGTGGALKLSVQVEIAGIVRYCKIQYWQVNTSLFDSSAKEFHWLVSADIKDTEDETANGMITRTDPDGRVIIVKPHSSSVTSIPIMQLRCVKPVGSSSLNSDKLYVYKYWKSALAPFDELMQNYKERNP